MRQIERPRIPCSAARARSRGTRNGGLARLFGPTYHVVSVPAILGVHGTIASVPWIFMQAIEPRERAHMPLSVALGLIPDLVSRDPSLVCRSGRVFGPCGPRALQDVVEVAFGDATAAPLGPQTGPPLGPAQCRQQRPVEIPRAGTGHRRVDVKAVGGLGDAPAHDLAQDRFNGRRPDLNCGARRVPVTTRQRRADRAERRTITSAIGTTRTDPKRRRVSPKWRKRQLQSVTGRRQRLAAVAEVWRLAAGRTVRCG